MSYHDQLTKLLEDKDFPNFTRSDFLAQLNSLADKMHSEGSVSGCLSSLLIYHQLCEEMIRVLINCSSLFVQLSVFPLEIKPKNLNGKMFGQLILELESSVCDNETKQLIEQVKKLNEIRIKIVHKITLKTNIYDIKKQSREAKKVFDKIYDLFDKIYDRYRLTFGKFSREVDEYRETAKEYLSE